MAKKKKESDEQVLEELGQSAVLDQLALGIAKLKNGKWALIELAFNVESGEADIQSITEYRSKNEASERFVITAARKGIA